MRNQGRFCLFYLLTMSVLVGCVSCGRQPGFMASPVKDGPALEFASPEQIAKGQVANNSYLVMFRGENTPESIYFSSFRDEYQHHYLRLQEDIAGDERVKDMDVLWTFDLSRKGSTEWAPEFDVPSALRLFWDDNDEKPVTGVMTKVDFASQDAAKEVLTEWNDNGAIWYAEPNGVSTLSADWKTNSSTYKSADVWWHNNINLATAMSTIDGLKDKDANSTDPTSGPIVAVLDSGADYEHPSLKDAIWTNASPGASGCDNDLHGCNTTAPSKGSLGNGEVWPVGATGPSQDIGNGKGGHGTHVAGIVGARGKDVLGVCPVCQVMVVKVAAAESGDTNSDPKIRDDSQIRGFKYITRFKKNGGSAVRVANSSFGKYSRSRSIAILVDALAKIGNGTIVIAAASNEDSMIRSYPAALNNAIAVAALRKDNQKASYSNFGPWVDIAAPGGKGNGDEGPMITSTWPGGRTHDSSGTSMASPVVAGAAGLYLAVYPSANIAQLKSKLVDTADGNRLYTDGSAAAQFNAQYYFPKVQGEEARRPLLGSGILDVQGMFGGGGKSAVGKPLARVSPGCSTIGATDLGTMPLYWLGVFLTSPVIVSMMRRRR